MLSLVIFSKSSVRLTKATRHRSLDSATPQSTSGISRSLLQRTTSRSLKKKLRLKSIFWERKQSSSKSTTSCIVVESQRLVKFSTLVAKSLLMFTQRNLTNSIWMLLGRRSRRSSTTKKSLICSNKQTLIPESWSYCLKTFMSPVKIFKIWWLVSQQAHSWEITCCSTITCIPNRHLKSTVVTKRPEMRLGDYWLFWMPSMSLSCAKTQTRKLSLWFLTFQISLRKSWRSATNWRKLWVSCKWQSSRCLLRLMLTAIWKPKSKTSSMKWEIPPHSNIPNRHQMPSWSKTGPSNCTSRRMKWMSTWESISPSALNQLLQLCWMSISSDLRVWNLPCKLGTN